MIDLNELKENFALDAAFKLSEPQEYVGKLDGGKDILERINLVLTQTFDAIGMLPFRQFTVKGEDKKVVIIYFKNDFFGVVADMDEDVVSILKYIYEEGSRVKKRGKVETGEQKAEVKEEIAAEAPVTEKEEIEIEEKVEEVKEEEKVEEEKVEEKREEEEVEKEVEEAKEVSVQPVVLNAKILDEIKEIAGNYLGDFSLDIVSNIVEDSGIDKDKPTKDQVLEVSNSLREAASLIIGPSKAGSLRKDILKKIEEVE